MKKIILKGVFETESFARAPRVEDLNQTKITLTFADAENPTQVTDLTFKIRLPDDGNICALLRAVVTAKKPVSSECDEVASTRKKEVTFEEKNQSQNLDRVKLLTEANRIYNDKLISDNEDLLKYLEAVEEITIEHAEWFSYGKIQNILKRVLALAPKLKSIEVPVGAACELSVNFHGVIWDSQIEVKYAFSNNDEMPSPLLPIEPINRVEPTDPINDNNQIEIQDEEQPWTNNEEYLSSRHVIYGLGVVAVYRIATQRERMQITPSHIFRAVNYFELAQQQISRAASYVPFLPTAMRIAGTVANATIMPVAEKIGVLKK